MKFFVLLILLLSAHPNIDTTLIRYGDISNELMKKATKNFKRVLRLVAVEKKFVLIVEQGGVVDYKSEDATNSCISKI